MTVRGKIIVGLAFLLGGWLCFDGLRALVTGVYTTPSSGPHAGQLGPWATVVVGLGLDPKSMGIKFLHIILGAFWIFAALREVTRRSTRAWFISCALASLWYLPFGTVISLVVLGLIFTRRTASVSTAR